MKRNGFTSVDLAIVLLITGRLNARVVPTQDHYFSAKYICYVEIFLDDSSMHGGRGRGFNLYELPDGTYTNCGALDDRAAGNRAAFYGFFFGEIFQ